MPNLDVASGQLLSGSFMSSSQLELIGVFRAVTARPSPRDPWSAREAKASAGQFPVKQGINREKFVETGRRNYPDDVTADASEAGSGRLTDQPSSRRS